jgi:D-3-phosphoglycerate dehydrogenase / 2-oxoglutarate reductase
MLAGPTVVITDSDLSSDDDEQVLRDAGFTTVRLQAKTESEVVAGLSRAEPDALIVQWAPVSAAVLTAAPRVRFISRLGAVTDRGAFPGCTSSPSGRRPRAGQCR